MIKSVQNDAVKEYRALCKKGKIGFVPLEGMRLICDALEASAEFDKIFIVDEVLSSEAGKKLLKLLSDRALNYITISTKVAEAMSLTKTPQGVFAIAKWSPYSDITSLSLKDGMIVALDGVSDPGNVGTIIRTAVAFGAQAIILGSESAKVTNPKVIRSSMGTLFNVACIESSNLSETLRKLQIVGFEIISADARGEQVDEMSPKKSFVLVIGGEAFGITEDVRDLSDKFVSVPMEQKVESLNAAIAAGILMFSLSRRD